MVTILILLVGAIFHLSKLFFACIIVEYFWPSVSLLLLFAYPTPEVPTPSFEFHTAFVGVALGVVSSYEKLIIF